MLRHCAMAFLFLHISKTTLCSKIHKWTKVTGWFPPSTSSIIPPFRSVYRSCLPWRCVQRSASGLVSAAPLSDMTGAESCHSSGTLFGLSQAPSYHNREPRAKWWWESWPGFVSLQWRSPETSAPAVVWFLSKRSTFSSHNPVKEITRSKLLWMGYRGPKWWKQTIGIS